MPDSVPTPIVLALNKPITTTTPQVSVTGFSVPGVYTFRLVVVDLHGFSSQPATIKVQVNRLILL